MNPLDLCRRGQAFKESGAVKFRQFCDTSHFQSNFFALFFFLAYWEQEWHSKVVNPSNPTILVADLIPACSHVLVESIFPRPILFLTELRSFSFLRNRHFFYIPVCAGIRNQIVSSGLTLWAKFMLSSLCNLLWFCNERSTCKLLLLFLPSNFVYTLGTVTDLWEYPSCQELLL